MKERKIAIVSSPCIIHNKKTIFKNAITRKQAVENIEKAMKRYAEDEEIFTDKDLAEVALNALYKQEPKKHKSSLKEFWRGFTSYPPTAYDIGQLCAENLIWTVFLAMVGIIVYLLIKI